MLVRNIGPMVQLLFKWNTVATMGYYEISSIELLVETVMSLLVKSANRPHILYVVFLLRHISLRSKQILILAFSLISRSFSVTCPAVTFTTLAVKEHLRQLLKYLHISTIFRVHN